MILLRAACMLPACFLTLFAMKQERLMAILDASRTLYQCDPVPDSLYLTQPVRPACWHKVVVKGKPKALTKAG